MAGNWDWHRRKEYSKREVESLAMLHEILSANRLSEKRAVISKFNPHFYTLFPDGVKRYESNKDCAENCEYGQTAKAELLPTESRIFRCKDEEEENRYGV